MVQVISGRVSITTSQETIECDTGTLVTFDPGERHSLHGIQDARLLLLLAPWPGDGPTPRQSHPTTSTSPKTRPPHRSPLHPPTTLESLPRPEADSITGTSASFLSLIDAFGTNPESELLVERPLSREVADIEHRRQVHE